MSISCKFSKIESTDVPKRLANSSWVLASKVTKLHKTEPSRIPLFLSTLKFFDFMVRKSLQLSAQVDSWIMVRKF